MVKNTLPVPRMKVSAVKPHPRNANVHPDAQVTILAKSLQEFGWTRPILLDGQHQIIYGHGIFAAAQKLGLKEVPVIVRDDLTDEQVRRYLIADNQLAQLSVRDETLLAGELADLADPGIPGMGLLELGFGPDDLKRMLGDDFGDFGPSDTPPPRLDELKDDKPVKCPECGHEFTP